VTPPWEKTDQVALSKEKSIFQDKLFTRRFILANLRQQIKCSLSLGRGQGAIFVGFLVGKPLGRSQQEISTFRASNPQLEPGAVLTRGGRWAKSRCFPLGNGSTITNSPRPPNSSSRSVSGLVTRFNLCTTPTTNAAPWFLPPWESESMVPLLLISLRSSATAARRSVRERPPGEQCPPDRSHSAAHYRVGGRSLRLRHAPATWAFPDPARLR